MSAVILAIESSCDETAAAILKNGKILNNVVTSQFVHHQYGGVVPEIASRAHQLAILPVVHRAIEDSGISLSDLNTIAVTQGPGLLGSLQVGCALAKALALSLDLNLVAVNHMEAHVWSHFIEEPYPSFPFLCLTVSGGHTEIILAKEDYTLHKLGETQDDAVGEAFDKAATMLGLQYPGGPLIDLHGRHGNPNRFRFSPTVMPNLHFSFSGIKTGFMYFLEDQKKMDPNFIENHLADLCASLQNHLVRMLMEKLEQASLQTGIRNISIAGGVAANSCLRASLQEKSKQHHWNIHIPKMEYCTDNAAMIAMAAYFKWKKNDFSPLTISPLPRDPIKYKSKTKESDITS